MEFRQSACPDVICLWKKTQNLILLAQRGDENKRQEAQSELIEANLPLVYSVVKRFYACGKEMEDLIQVGTIGLLKAIIRFDFSYHVCFSTYAVPMIMGEIRRFIRDDSPISISRSQKENTLMIKKKREEWVKQYGTEPTLQELAEILSMNTEDVLACLETSLPLLSLHEVVSQDDEGGPVLMDQVQDKNGNAATGEWDLPNNSGINEMIDQWNIRTVLAMLPPRLQHLIQLRYFEDKTQTQVAKELELSQVQVCRLEKQAFGI